MAFFSNKNHDNNAKSNETINLPKKETNEGRLESKEKTLNTGKCHK